MGINVKNRWLFAKNLRQNLRRFCESQFSWGFQQERVDIAIMFGRAQFLYNIRTYCTQSKQANSTLNKSSHFWYQQPNVNPVNWSNWNSSIEFMMKSGVEVAVEGFFSTISCWVSVSMSFIWMLLIALAVVWEELASVQDWPPFMGSPSRAFTFCANAIE